MLTSPLLCVLQGIEYNIDERFNNSPARPVADNHVPKKVPRQAPAPKKAPAPARKTSEPPVSFLGVSISILQSLRFCTGILIDILYLLQAGTPKKSKNADEGRATRTSPVKPWKCPPSNKCNHSNCDNPLSYGIYGSGYYTKIEREKKPYLPTHCLLCQVQFVWGRGKKDVPGSYHVNKEIRACEGCFSPGDGEYCNRAFCGKCYTIACSAMCQISNVAKL